jgi:hypothetical protein
MTTPSLRQIARAELVSTLERSDHTLAPDLIAVLGSSPREASYSSASQSASSLSRVLRIKYGIAVDAGIPLAGHQEILDLLSSLGAELVRGVGVESELQSYTVFLRDEDGSVLGIVRVRKKTAS